MSWECNWGIWEIVISTYVYVVSKVVSKKKNPLQLDPVLIKLQCTLGMGSLTQCLFIKSILLKYCDKILQLSLGLSTHTI